MYYSYCRTRHLDLSATQIIILILDHSWIRQIPMTWIPEYYIIQITTVRSLKFNRRRFWLKRCLLSLSSFKRRFSHFIANKAGLNQVLKPVPRFLGQQISRERSYRKKSGVFQSVTHRDVTNMSFCVQSKVKKAWTYYSIFLLACYQEATIRYNVQPTK